MLSFESLHCGGVVHGGMLETIGHEKHVTDHEAVLDLCGEVIA